MAAIRLGVAFLALSGLLIAGCSRRDSTAAGVDAPPSEATPASASASKSDLLPVGTLAPDFRVKAHDGQQVSLSGLRGQVVILYFYPKDGTPGCTVEAQQFTLAHEDLKSKGAVVLGVSSDDSDSHAEFAREQGLPFLLLPDEDHGLARAYGVRTTFGMTQRVTFIIDQSGTIAKVYGDVSPKTHAREILADLEQLKVAGKSTSTN